MARSALLNVMVAAVRKSTRGLNRDFGEVENLQVSRKGPGDFVTAGYDYIGRLLEALDYVGVLAMECFVTAEGLLINELAPRVHNSGHWTLRSEATSQFENHLRAILGMNLGATRVSRFDGIINILGQYDRAHALRAMSRDSTLIDYNKSFAPRRKLGHINVSRGSREAIEEELGRLQNCLYVDTELHALQGRSPDQPGGDRPVGLGTG